MRKLVILLLTVGCLLLSGCMTPQVVYDDLALVKENIVLQKQVTDALLKGVQPQSDKQVEALAVKKLEVERRFDRMAAALNRLVLYFEAEREVGYLINVLDFMRETNLKGLLGQVERTLTDEEVHARIYQIAKSRVDNLAHGYIGRVPGPPAGY